MVIVVLHYFEKTASLSNVILGCTLKMFRLQHIVVETINILLPLEVDVCSAVAGSAAPCVPCCCFTCGL